MLTFRFADENNCGKILEFIKALYRSLGAEPMDEWTTYRLTGETLKKLAE